MHYFLQSHTFGHTHVRLPASPWILYLSMSISYRAWLSVSRFLFVLCDMLVLEVWYHVVVFFLAEQHRMETGQEEKNTEILSIMSRSVFWKKKVLILLKIQQLWCKGRFELHLLWFLCNHDLHDRDNGLIPRKKVLGHLGSVFWVFCLSWA